MTIDPCGYGLIFNGDLIGMFLFGENARVHIVIEVLMLRRHVRITVVSGCLEKRRDRMISPMSHSCGDLEVRTCSDHLGQVKEPHTTAEIVRWFFEGEIRKYNITLAFFEKGLEGYNLKFIGERVFDPDVSPYVFLQLAEIGLRYLQSCQQEASDGFVISRIVNKYPHLFDPEEEQEDSKESYEAIGAGIGRLVTQKQAQYGNSFGVAPKILGLLYPDGVKSDQYDSLLSVVRILDKLKRIATQHPSDTENPWEDIGGYSILELAKKIRVAKL